MFSECVSLKSVVRVFIPPFSVFQNDFQGVVSGMEFGKDMFGEDMLCQENSVAITSDQLLQLSATQEHNMQHTHHHDNTAAAAANQEEEDDGTSSLGLSTLTLPTATTGTDRTVTASSNSCSGTVSSGVGSGDATLNPPAQTNTATASSNKTSPSTNPAMPSVAVGGMDVKMSPFDVAAAAAMAVMERQMPQASASCGGGSRQSGGSGRKDSVSSITAEDGAGDACDRTDISGLIDMEKWTEQASILFSGGFENMDDILVDNLMLLLIK